MHARRTPKFTFTVLASALLLGCASAPPFTPPAAPEVRGYTADALVETTASAPLAHGHAQRIALTTNTATAPEAAWWKALQAPALDALIDQALSASPTLAAAHALLEQAQAQQRAQTGATQLPRVDLSLGVQRQLSSPAAQGQAGEGREFSLYSANVGVRYAFDLSGANRAALEALAARTAWRRHELDAARLTLAGQIATSAITRASLAARIDASEALLGGQLEQAQLARERERLGQTAPDEALALTTQAEQTRATLPLLRQQLQQSEHLLALLSGQPPGAARIPAFTLAGFTLPETLPLMVPSQLVRQRPDIQASEALLHAAHAERGAAIARRYPQLNLSASLGSQALTARALFGGASAVWAVAGQLAAPLLNPAQSAEEDAAQAALQAASANYQGVVLQALRSVADALRAVDHDAQALQALASADASARQSLRVAQEHLRLGAASHAQMLLVQQQASQTRLQLASAQAQRLIDSVALLQALGGMPTDMRSGTSG